MQSWKSLLGYQTRWVASWGDDSQSGNISGCGSFHWVGMSTERSDRVPRPQPCNQEVSDSTGGGGADQPQRGQRVEHPSPYDSRSSHESLSRRPRCCSARSKPHVSKGIRPGNAGSVAGYASCRSDDSGGSDSVASASKSFMAGTTRNPGHDEKSTRGGGRRRPGESGRGNDDEELASSAWIEKLGAKELREAS